MDWTTGAISGQDVEESTKTLGQLAGIFADVAAWRATDLETAVYRVKFWRPVANGTPGGLFWGATTIEPERVGNEYFVTHGHFHAIRDRAEFYATVKGEGALLLMDERGETRNQTMRPGTLHYIPGHVAHRAANTGNEPLIFLTSWSSDAEHDYDTIKTSGFSKHLVLRDGEPCLV